MIALKSTTKERSSKSEAVQITLQEFDRAVEVQRDDFDRGAKARRRYFPINYGKWDPEALKVLQEEFRQPIQFDISSPRVDTLAGSLISDLPDPTWVPVQGQRGVTTEAIADTYYTDKDLYNYDDAFLRTFRDGLVHASDIIVCEDYKYGVPRIKLEPIMFGYLVWDPYWLTEDDRDAELYFRLAFLNPNKLARKFKNLTDDIEKAAKEYNRDKSGFPIDAAEQQKNRQLGKVGDEFQVIEKHFLEFVSTTRLMGRREGEENFIPFPINKERAYIEAFADANKIDWTTVIEIPYDDKIEYVTTVCRELDICIQEKVKSKIQVNGLSAHHFTARRYAGKNLGIIESIGDVEDTINKRESLITELISKAGGGSTLVNQELFNDPKKWQDWVKNSNKPGHKERVPLDEVKNIMQHMVPNQSSIAAQDQISRMYTQVLPLVSRVSEALASMSDSKDSGILFERKFQVNMIANTLLNRNIRQFINNVAESYFFQWQITYADYEQEVMSRDGKSSIVLNKRRGGMIYNDVRNVPRCRVVIAENTKSQTYQMRWRSVWSEMLTSINPQVAPAHYILALKNFFETIQTNDEDKVAIKVINEIAMMVSRLNLVAQATGFQAQAQGNTLQSAQIDMQLQQIMQQLQGLQQPPPPMGHMEPQGQQEINYPNETPEQGFSDTVNPPTIEEASGSMQTSPALTGAYQ